MFDPGTALKLIAIEPPISGNKQIIEMYLYFWTAAARTIVMVLVKNGF